MKHTEGPWTTARVGNAVVVSSKVLGLIARLPFRIPHDPFQDELQEANARLIAAAPDLYDIALRMKAEGAIGHYHGPLGGCLACDLEAAIAKAEGSPAA